MLKLPQGTYIDTEEAEYRKWPAINYSSLADFHESQDHALLGHEPKSYFEEGRAFELLVEDRAKKTAKFAKRFFIADAPGTMPDDLAGWIENGEDLKSKYVWNKPDKKTGEVVLNGKCERKHKWLDECIKKPGKMPMGSDRMGILNKMVDNFMKMQPFADIGMESPLSEILPIAHFQVPVVWSVKSSPDKSAMRKKGLIDCLVETPETVYVWDIKTAADKSRFMWMLKNKYWIQEAHYTEGLRAIFPNKNVIWQFLVASKTVPYLSQPFCVEPRGMSEYGTEVYFHLCERYQEWLFAGRPAKGWKTLEAVNVYFGNIG